MSDEKALRDAIIRKQVYLEGVKLSAPEDAEERITKLGEVIAALLLGLGVAKLSEVTLAELRKLIAKMRKIVTTRFKAFNSQMSRFIMQFTRVEKQLSEALHRKLFTPAKPLPTMTQIMGRVRSAIIPGVGRTIGEMIGGDLGKLRDEITAMLRGGYANEETIQALIARIQGTRAKQFRDGWLGKVKRGVKTAVATALQHVTGIVGNATGAAFFGQYQWVSVIDEKTTDICLSRDGEVYVYGRGPVPPAHYNCRSTTVPYFEEALTDWKKTNWFDWATDQPASVLDDMVGVTASRAMRAADASASDFPRLTTVKPLSLADYSNKINRLFDE
jgi:SPP1 gp7 family putative phage head morphogenesis protein